MSAGNVRWVKHGLIFTAERQREWMASHAQLPVIDPVSPDVLRIYFGARDEQNRCQVAFVDVDAADPRKIVRLCERPALGLGELGCFDDRGAMPSWIVNHNGRKYLYYSGVNTSTTVPVRGAIGLAISSDDGETFERVFPGPILERSHEEAHICVAPCVLSGPVWRMWYVSGVRWEVVDGHPEYCYNIRYTESSDGMHWRRPGTVCIDFQNPEEGGLARPSVFLDGELYRMWFCSRGRVGFRTDKTAAYRIGYAESRDGIAWVRDDSRCGIVSSEEGWDSEMIAYPHVFSHGGRTYMFYNGNGFGRSGFGYAVMERG